MASKRKKAAKVPVTVPPTEALSLGLYFRQAREAKGLTLAAAAELFGRSSAQFLYNIEHELCMLPKKHIKPLAKAYGIEEKEIRINIVKYLVSKIRVKYGFKP